MPRGGHNAKFPGESVTRVTVPTRYKHLIEDFADFLYKHSIDMSGKQEAKLFIINGKVVKFLLKPSKPMIE